MPFSNGVYTPPTGAENATAGKVIASATWNSIFTDLSTALTQIGSGTIPLLFVQSGTLPWVQADSYAAGSSGSGILAVRGTTAAPITTGVATAIFQSVNNTSTDSGQTIYGSLIKKNVAAIDHRGIFVEAVDNAGGSGSSISGGRFTVSLLVGTAGNGTGVTAVAVTGSIIPYKYLIGGEHQTFNNSGTDATTTFASAKFAAGMLSSNFGTNRVDAGYLINPFTALSNAGKGFITGFFITTNAAGAGLDTVVDTGFRCDASCVNGIDLSRGTYSGSAIKSTGFSVDNTGDVTAVGIIAGVSSGILWAGRSIMISPADGNITFTNNAGTGFTSLQFGGTTSSFPEIKRNSAALNFRLADDSADAAITAGSMTGSGSLSTAAPVIITTSTKTSAATDSSYIFTTSSTLSPVTLTLPTASLNPGRILTVLNQAPTAVVSAASNVVLLAGSGGTPGTPIIVSTSGKFAVLVAASTYWQVTQSN